MTANLQSLKYSNEGGAKPALAVLDQLLIPHEKVYIDIPDVEAAWTVIRTMQIRGAPLIAMVACLGLSVDLNTNVSTIGELDGIDANDSQTLLSFIHEKMDYLATSRPTAVNLFNAMKELKLVLEEASTGSDGTVRERLCQAVNRHAEFMLRRDVADNEAIGAFGAAAILRHTTQSSARVVTICNTGSLATAGYGTALGVVRALHAQGKLESIHALETRPYNQGSRLTAFEIMEEQMPNGTLICDSAAGALMKLKGVDACVVGADRVCANGDTANKIGTYNLSLVAAAHGVPFYIAAPFTTLDVSLKTGDEIEIEERPAAEMIVSGNAPANMPCWNPAFDVTPAKYIAGIITEKGVIEPNIDGTIDVAAFVEKHKAEESSVIQSTTKKIVVPSDYQEQSVASLPAYLAKNAPVAMEHLETTSIENLECLEVGDGNLNLVFIVTNTQNQKKIIVKQALPYVRCVGESWPLTLERSFFEYKALCAEKVACPAFVPAVFFFSKANGLMVMEYIPPPNIILRKGLISGIRYPTMASDMGIFCAKTLFKGSGFKLSETELRKQVQFWSTNVEMCALTEQVVFTEPYITADNNRWTSPQLDGDKKAIEEDALLKVEAAKLMNKFVTETQTLLHGDLHTGSVMCAPADNQTFVIDPEFAFYGPIGFDTGAFLANLLLSYCSQSGHSNGDDYTEWLLETIKTFYASFESEFIKLWNDETEHTGMYFRRLVLGDEDAIAMAQKEFMASLFQDTVGFAGMKMLRRVVGIAHVEDMESIEDTEVKAKCERHALEIAKSFIKGRSSLSTIDDVLKIARDLKP